jgi:hypothetical protein
MIPFVEMQVLKLRLRLNVVWWQLTPVSSIIPVVAQDQEAEGIQGEEQCDIGEEPHEDPISKQAANTITDDFGD